MYATKGISPQMIGIYLNLILSFKCIFYDVVTLKSESKLLMQV